MVESRGREEGISDDEAFPVPIHTVEVIIVVTRLQQAMTQELGRQPTADEMGQRLGLSAHEVDEVLEVARQPVDDRIRGEFLAHIQLRPEER